MKGQVLTVKEIGEFEEYLTLEERSAATIEKYMRDVRAFVDYVGNKEISKEAVIGYKKH